MLSSMPETIQFSDYALEKYKSSKAAIFQNIADAGNVEVL